MKQLVDLLGLVVRVLRVGGVALDITGLWVVRRVGSGLLVAGAILE